MGSNRRGSDSSNQRFASPGNDVASRYVDYLETLASRWSSAQAATLINKELLEYLVPRFHRCSTPMKVRIVLSFLYLGEQIRHEAKAELLKILSEGEVDHDEWVKKLSRVISSFIIVGSIDVRETDSETAFNLLRFLNDQKTKHKFVYLNKPPLEAPHMANVLTEKFIHTHVQKSSREESETPCAEIKLPSGALGPRSSTTADVKSKAEEPPTPSAGFDWVESNPNSLFGIDFINSSKCVPESTHYKPAIDFLAFTAELMRPGETAMRKAWKRNQQAKSKGR